MYYIWVYKKNYVTPLFDLDDLFYIQELDREWGISYYKKKELEKKIEGLMKGEKEFRPSETIREFLGATYEL